MIKLHNYYRSGTSHRVRIGLNLKQLTWQYVAVNLLEQAHKQPEFMAINPQGLAPVIEIDGVILQQSPAILEYLEETRPTIPLLPQDVQGRARVRAMSMMIGCDIHPLNNLRVLNRVKAETGTTRLPEEWIAHWIHEGFGALETMLNKDTDRNKGFCFGSRPTLVECYLIPQVYSANRFGVDLSAYPNIKEIDNNCATIPAFKMAHPDHQPDAP